MRRSIVDCFDESHHNGVISNEYTRVMKVKIPSKESAAAHKHTKKSLYFFLTEDSVEISNLVYGSKEPVSDRVEFGEIRYCAHSDEDCLVHRITNTDSENKAMACVDVEILRTPPVTATDPLVDEHHVLTKTMSNCRVYKLTLQPNEEISVSYPFFYLSLVLKGGTIQTTVGTGNDGFSWETAHKVGGVDWNSPSIGKSIRNTGTTVFETYIVEWC